MTVYLTLTAAVPVLSVIVLWALGCPVGALAGNLIDYLRWRYSSR